MPQGLWAFDLPSRPGLIAPRLRCIEAAVPALQAIVRLPHLRAR